MKKILVVCPAGIGSSTVMAIWLRDVLEEEGIEADIVTAEALTVEGIKCDLIVGTPWFVETLTSAAVPVVGIINVTSKDEYRHKVLPHLRS